MANPWEEARREEERRRRELASLQERRLAEFAGKLTRTKVVWDYDEVPNEISLQEYRRDQEGELDKEIVRAMTREPRQGGYGE